MPYTMTFSPREREILDAIRRSEAVSFNTLVQFFEDRMDAHEIGVIIDRFRNAGLVNVAPTARTQVISLTFDGRHLAEEMRRHG